MGRTAVTEEIKIELDGLKMQALFGRLFLQHFHTVFTLGAGGNLKSAGNQVKAAGKGWVFRLAHVIEGTHYERHLITAWHQARSETVS